MNNIQKTYLTTYAAKENSSTEIKEANETRSRVNRVATNPSPLSPIDANALSVDTRTLQPLKTHLNYRPHAPKKWYKISICIFQGTPIYKKIASLRDINLILNEVSHHFESSHLPVILRFEPGTSKHIVEVRLAAFKERTNLGKNFNFASQQNHSEIIYITPKALFTKNSGSQKYANGTSELFTSGYHGGFNHLAFKGTRHFMSGDREVGIFDLKTRALVAGYRVESKGILFIAPPQLAFYVDSTDPKDKKRIEILDIEGKLSVYEKSMRGYLPSEIKVEDALLKASLKSSSYSHGVSIIDVLEHPDFADKLEAFTEIAFKEELTIVAFDNLLLAGGIK